MQAAVVHQYEDFDALVALEIGIDDAGDLSSMAAHDDDTRPVKRMKKADEPQEHSAVSQSCLFFLSSYY